MAEPPFTGPSLSTIRRLSLPKVDRAVHTAPTSWSLRPAQESVYCHGLSYCTVWHPGRRTPKALDLLSAACRSRVRVQYLQRQGWREPSMAMTAKRMEVTTV